MRRAADGDAVPAVLGDLHPGAGDPRVRAGEVPGQPQPEVLDLADPVPGEGEDGVLLRVGGQHVRVVAGQVGGGEVAAQRASDTVRSLSRCRGAPRSTTTTRTSALPYWLGPSPMPILSSPGRWCRPTARAAAGRGGARPRRGR